MVQSQEEFYFSLPYETMDLCLYAKNHGISVDGVAAVTGLTADEVTLVYREIEAKREATAYLHVAELTVDKVPEIPFE
jgi:NAD+ synthase